MQETEAVMKEMARQAARDRAGRFADLSTKIEEEFVRQFRELTNIRFEAREKRFIDSLFPSEFEQRHP